MFMAKDSKINSLIQSLHHTIKNDKQVTIYGPLKILSRNQIQTQAKIYVDGGIIHATAKKQVISIGDGDSAFKKMIFNYPKNKDKSDLSLALKLIKSKQITIYLRGFLPDRQIENRFDHLLANFGEAYFHAKVKKNLIDFDQNIRIYPAGIYQFQFKGKFSLILFESTNISLQGKIQFPITTLKKFQPFQSDLISNMAKGNFQVIANRPFLLIRY